MSKRKGKKTETKTSLNGNGTAKMPPMGPKPDAPENPEELNPEAEVKTPDPNAEERAKAANEPDEIAEEKPADAVKMVPKRVTCTRCKGDGIWHSSRTGVRAVTSSEPSSDTTRKCPRCKGSKKTTIMITEEQAKEEAKARAKASAAEAEAEKAERKASKAKAASDKAAAKVENLACKGKGTV